MASLERLMLKLERRDHVSPAEKLALERAGVRIDTHRARENIVLEDVLQSESRLLLDGVTSRYKALRDGRRQIMAFHIAGDFIDLHSFTLKKLDHNIAAVTPARVAIFPHDALRQITETEPHLTRLLWLNTMLDAAMHREWVVSAGRRSAIGHVANLLCEMFIRSQVVGLADGNRYPLPITQEDVADACGLTSIHVNRVVQELRGTGAIEWRHGTVVIRDWPALQGIADFDPSYLGLDFIPR